MRAPEARLEVGSAGGSGVVVVRMGTHEQVMDPPTARALAVLLIHRAEIAGLPPAPSISPEPGVEGMHEV